MLIVEFIGLPLIVQVSSQMSSIMPLGTCIAPLVTDNDLVPHTYFVSLLEPPPLGDALAFQINVAPLAYGKVKNEFLYVTIVLNNWYSTVYPWLSCPLL